MSQVTLACDNLQEGVNSIEVKVLEDSEALESVADAFKDTFGTSF